MVECSPSTTRSAAWLSRRLCSHLTQRKHAIELLQLLMLSPPSAPLLLAFQSKDGSIDVSEFSKLCQGLGYALTSEEVALAVKVHTHAAQMSWLRASLHM